MKKLLCSSTTFSLSINRFVFRNTEEPENLRSGNSVPKNPPPLLDQILDLVLSNEDLEHVDSWVERIPDYEGADQEHFSDISMGRYSGGAKGLFQGLLEGLREYDTNNGCQLADTYGQMVLAKYEAHARNDAPLSDTFISKTDICSTILAETDNNSPFFTEDPFEGVEFLTVHEKGYFLSLLAIAKKLESEHKILYSEQAEYTKFVLRQMRELNRIILEIAKKITELQDEGLDRVEANEIGISERDQLFVFLKPHLSYAAWKTNPEKAEQAVKISYASAVKARTGNIKP